MSVSAQDLLDQYRALAQREQLTPADRAEIDKSRAQECFRDSQLDDYFDGVL